MSQYSNLIRKLDDRASEEKLSLLYGVKGTALEAQKKRYRALLENHEKAFHAEQPVMIFSAPGRTEIGGNHTDHNNGRVLAASVNLDTLCAASAREDLQVNFLSEGYPALTLSLENTDPRAEEEGTTAALIRGVADGMKRAGRKIGGFDAVVTSTVAGGSGLSSSAALEVMLTGLFDGMYNDFSMPFVERAQISKRAENLYFGKPSGLLDQMASAAGGLVTVDFADEQDPKVKALQYDFAARGYSLVVVGTGASHADLTDQYAAIPAEMKAIAACFGQKTLRGISADQLLCKAGELREKCGERALLRAFHFVAEDERVPKQVLALEEDRTEDFLALILESGRSSFMYLQNVYAPNGDQGLSLALCMAEEMLRGKGAWRVHGGGFAGTTLNFVPTAEVPAFVDRMEATFGAGACHVLNIRPVGADMFWA